MTNNVCVCVYMCEKDWENEVAKAGAKGGK